MIELTKYRDIVEDALQMYCKRWSKKEGVGVYALNDWKNDIQFVHKILFEEFEYEICIPYLIKGVQFICYACVCIVRSPIYSVYIMSDNFLMIW